VFPFGLDVDAILIYHVAQPPSPFPFHPSTPVVGSRDRIGIETLPLLYHEERTAITWRTNRRVALFNSKANKKLADRERIRQVKGEEKKE